MRQADRDGKVRHGEIKIGDSSIVIRDEFGEFPQMRGAQALGGSPVQVFRYGEDVDAHAAQAQAAGETLFIRCGISGTGAREGCCIRLVAAGPGDPRRRGRPPHLGFHAIDFARELGVCWIDLAPGGVSASC